MVKLPKFYKRVSMLRKIFLLSLFVLTLNATLINAIAVVVNNKVITLYDIDNAIQQKNLSHNQAVSFLIDKILFQQELEKQDIVVTDFDINEYISKLAMVNHMTKEQFIKILNEKQNYSQFVDQIHTRLQKEKLASKLSIGKLKIATKEDMQMYYKNNIDKFKVSQNSLKVIPFDQVKDKIFNVLMQQRQQEYLKEYFDKLKISANIKIIR